MAKGKQKPEDEDLDDVEVDLADEAEELEEDQDESEEGSDDKKDDEDSSEEEQEASEDSSDESEEASKKKEPTEAELEEKRARRRREKQLRKQRQQRERLEQQNLIIMMAEEIKRLKEGHSETQKTQREVLTAQIDERMSTAKSIYNRSIEALKKAISEGDPEAFVAATQQKDQAERAYRALSDQKQRFIGQREERQESKRKEESAKEQESSSEGVELDNSGKRHLKNFISKNSWFKPNSPDLDTKTALAIDADLYEEGYDPNSPEYWEELQDRVKQRLPHLFRRDTSKPKNIVGGNNKSSIGGKAPESVSLPKEFVQALKDADMWDDEKKRKEAIKQYHANKKGS